MEIDYENGYIDENGNFVYVKDYKKNFLRIEELKQNLKDTDYKAIKYAEGQISEQDYASIKTLRQAWRDEINELERQSKR